MRQTPHGRRIVRIVLLLLIAAIAVLLYTFDPLQHTLMPKCPFRLLTGLNCPGCGIQRALHAMLHGHWAEAARCNFYLVYAGPYALAFLVQRWFMSGQLQQRVGAVLEHRYVVNFYIITFFIWLIARNIFGI